jgi:hypothetical protein
VNYSLAYPALWGWEVHSPDFSFEIDFILSNKPFKASNSRVRPHYFLFE